MRVLVTGGAGYIGSHACQRLLHDGHHVVALDNLFRGHREAIGRLEGLGTGRIIFVEADAGDTTRVADALEAHEIDTVMHFGARAYVGESVDDPLSYYRANINAGVGLLQACDAPESRVRRFVFSSSCATYGDPPEGLIPVPETCPQRPTSPYGRTKLQFEEILRDWSTARARADRPISIAMLRYFNVAGADRTGLLGEDHDPETHLVPVAINAALGRRPGLTIFGTDYPTPDGTCVRDYVHVEDLVDAHVRAIDALAREGDNPVRAYNVGIGRGYSVREIIDSVSRVAGREIEVAEGPRRAGDATMLYNDPTLITRELGWQPRVTDLDEIVATAHRWMVAHPSGYAEP
ncbi:MAG: UDP-glucose 4-epimerase GalE [Planctomycetota bacterium]